MGWVARECGSSLPHVRPPQHGLALRERRPVPRPPRQGRATLLREASAERGAVWPRGSAGLRRCLCRQRTDSRITHHSPGDETTHWWDFSVRGGGTRVFVCPETSYVHNRRT